LPGLNIWIGFMSPIVGGMTEAVKADGVPVELLEPVFLV
jgi:hypothetical protein